MVWMAALLVVIASSASSAGATSRPAGLCTVLRSEGFSGSTRWQDQGGGVWGCSTARKRLPQGEPGGTSDVRYLVLGSEDQARELRLELRMRSSRGPQGVLLRFHRLAETMVERALGRQLPSGVGSAVLSAVNGKWIADGYRFRLEKRFSRGPVYDLWFSVEPLDQSKNLFEKRE